MRMNAIRAYVFCLGILAVYACHTNAFAQQPAAETSKKAAVEDGEKKEIQENDNEPQACLSLLPTKSFSKWYESN